MSHTERAVLVVGAGVSGLTTALALAEAGVDVELCAQAPPARTTSAAAGASWGPYMVNHEMADPWSETSLAELTALATDPGTGVSIVQGIDASRMAITAPEWVQKLETYEPCDPGELPDGYVCGWRYETAVVDMPVYLGYLAQRLAGVGVDIRLRTVASLQEAAADRIVVNCTGVAARELCHDKLIEPTKGQLVVVRNPGIEHFFQDCDDEEEEELIYILPHGKHVVLGGCATKDVTDPNPNFDVAREIVNRCARIDSRLNYAEMLEHRVGVRPSRSRVRLEREGNIVHNYGHGGAGLTLSWGCAASVLDLVRELGVAHGV